MKEPEIHYAHKNWLIVNKPHGMPTAPLVHDETDTLLHWVIQRYPEAMNVIGRKNIEHGLIHRLDTLTEGLVLIALTQSTYEYFLSEQKSGKIQKHYCAICDQECTNDQLSSLILEKPTKIVSKFKRFGQRGREVRPLFDGMRGYTESTALYETTLESLSKNGKTIVVECSLYLGYRHQIRAHLAFLGLPIQGDPLYNKKYHDQSIHKDLQLTAHTISFYDPDLHTRESFSLRQQDKMIL